MRTVGVDLSVSERQTALMAIEWGEDRARVGEPSSGLADDALLDLLAEAEWVGIDAPFGWPEPMVSALRDYAGEGRWPTIAKQDFRYRRTDSFVREHVAAEVERKLSPCPAAALLLWGLERSGYKTGEPGGVAGRSSRLRIARRTRLLRCLFSSDAWRPHGEQQLGQEALQLLAPALTSPPARLCRPPSRLPAEECRSSCRFGDRRSLRRSAARTSPAPRRSAPRRSVPSSLASAPAAKHASRLS